MTDEDSTRFVTGLQLYWSQIRAMATKKFLYSIRNPILILLQFSIPAIFIVLSLLNKLVYHDDKELPELSISFTSYSETVTTMAIGSISKGSLIEKITASYKSIFDGLPDEHKLITTHRDFEDDILQQYNISLSDTNLKNMVGATFNDSVITVWFNNQAFHTAPLAINTVNNAILK